MAWRQTNSLAAAISVAKAAGRDNGGALVDALHLSRTGGTLKDVAAADPCLVRREKLCPSRNAGINVI
jgi:hypothetical protein